MKPLEKFALATMGAAVLGHHGPGVAAIAPLRRALLPALAGQGTGPGIALTFDDGPDDRSTPAFLDLLAEHDVKATFFLLGEHVQRNAASVRRIADEGHEIAVHGWNHQCLAIKMPGLLGPQVRHTVEVIEDVAGVTPRFYRPPYGVLTGEVFRVVPPLGLRPVLWTAWGRDWTANHSAPEQIVRRVERAVRPGGVVLLHDSDRTSAPDSWRRTLAATTVLLPRWAERGEQVETLSDHLG